MDRYPGIRSGWPACGSCAAQHRACARSLLGPEPVCEGLLIDALPDGIEVQSLLHSALETLARHGALWRKVIQNGVVIAQLEPLGNHYRFAFASASAPESVSFGLSRFCLMRPDNGDIVLKSPLAHARLRILHPAVVASIASLAVSGAVPHEEMGGQNPAPPAAELLSLLAIEGFLEGPHEEMPGDLARRHWEFHDLLFHSRSSGGRIGAVVEPRFAFAARPSPCRRETTHERVPDRVAPARPASTYVQ